jgi:hypothetical protein
MSKANVDYEKRTVVLSRVYPFGEKKKAKVRGVERDVTVVTVHELNGVDDEQLLKQKNPSVYDEIAVSCGITVEEAKKLSRCDAQLINEVQQSFLFDSEEIELLD